MELVLSRETEELLRNQLATGRYASTDEVIRAALILLKTEERGHRWTREELLRELDIGIDQAERGELTPFDFDEFRRECYQRLDKRQVE